MLISISLYENPWAKIENLIVSGAFWMFTLPILGFPACVPIRAVSKSLADMNWRLILMSSR